MAQAARMTQSQVVRHLAQKNGLTNKAARGFLESLVDLSVQQTKRAGIFVLPGLGRMKKVQRKARMGRNPATGEPIKISARTAVKFYLAKAARDAVALPRK